jgi:hypothetical protein
MQIIKTTPWGMKTVAVETAVAQDHGLVRYSQDGPALQFSRLDDVE